MSSGFTSGSEGLPSSSLSASAATGSGEWVGAGVSTETGTGFAFAGLAAFAGSCSLREGTAPAADFAVPAAPRAITFNRANAPSSTFSIPSPTRSFTHTVAYQMCRSAKPATRAAATTTPCAASNSPASTASEYTDNATPGRNASSSANRTYAPTEPPLPATEGEVSPAPNQSTPAAAQTVSMHHPRARSVN